MSIEQKRPVGRLSKIVVAAALSALLAACASHPKPTPVPPAPPPAAPAPPPPESPPPPPPPRGENAVVPGSEKDFVINVGDRVYFDYDKYEIRSDAEGVLASQAAWLNRYPDVRVRIEGNCDDRGTAEYNFALGARRADAVKAFLVNHGVNLGRIATVSYGKERPIDPGTGDEASQHNRNAHTAITSGAS